MYEDLIGDFYIESFHGDRAHYQGNIHINDDREFSEKLSLPFPMLGTYETLFGSLVEEDESYILLLTVEDYVICPKQPIMFSSTVKLYLDQIDNLENKDIFTFSGADEAGHDFKVILSR